MTYAYIVRAPDKSSLLLIGLIVLACNVVVSSWSSYNYIRFVGKTRRRGATAVTHEAVGKFFGITDPATISLLSKERRLNLHFDAGGSLVNVEVLRSEDEEKLLVTSETPP